MCQIVLRLYSVGPCAAAVHRKSIYRHPLCQLVHGILKLKTQHKMRWWRDQEVGHVGHCFVSHTEAIFAVVMIEGHQAVYR